MKQYIKDGVIKAAKEIVVIKDEFQFINPSEEILFSDGWTLWEPKPEKELSQEEILNNVKDVKIQELLEYDKNSNEINGFFINETALWFNKIERISLKNRFEAEKTIGKIVTYLWYNNESFNITIDQGLQLLHDLEIYASACYDNTHNHISNILKLKNIDEIENYNYKTNYPKKIKLII